MREIYLSIDVESLGPVAGIHPMISLGAVAVDAEGKNHGEFFQNLKDVTSLAADPETVYWWSQQSEEARAALFNPAPREAFEVMTGFAAFVRSLKDQSDTVVFAASPAAFDLPFVAYYAHRFLGIDFVRRTFCIKSAAQAILQFSPKEKLLEAVPKEWLRGTAGLAHKAVDDARNQAAVLVSVLQYWRGCAYSPNGGLPKT